jgi:predicted PurR-regulated permease PerM
MNSEGNNAKKKSNIITIIIIGIVLLVVLNFTGVVNIVKTFYGVIFPLLLGAGIAFVLNIVVKEYEKIYFPKSQNKMVIKSRRGVSILLSILTIILVLLFFLRIVIPQIAEFIRVLTVGFPVLYDKVVAWTLQHANDIPGLREKVLSFNMDGEAVVRKSLELLGNGAFGTVSFIGTVFGTIFEYILAFTFSIYILFSKETLKNNFDKIFNAFMRSDRRKKLYEGLRTTNETFASYFLGQFKEAIILGVLCTIGMLLLRFPYATIIGPVIGLTALIPMVGAYIGAAVGFLLIVIIDPLQAVLFILFIVVLQQIEGNLIYPKVVGQSIGLPGIWVFAAVTVGGGLMGITGIMLGVPIAATVYKLLGKSVNERLT